MNAVRCSYCGHEGVPLAVHGHGQCAHCGTNIEPCCAGADALAEACALPRATDVPDVAWFARVFEQLGGRAATVTTEALRFALVQRLGGDLDDAQLLVDAARHVGVLVEAGPGLLRLHGGPAARGC